jgi:hypothetical protein
MSASMSFTATSIAASSLLDPLLKIARSHLHRNGNPFLPDLVSAANEACVELPLLNAFARTREQRPCLLICGGDSKFASDVAATVGYDLTLLEFPAAPVVYLVSPDEQPRLELKSAESCQSLTFDQLHEVFRSGFSKDDLSIVEEHVCADADWKFIWIPHPEALEPFLTTSTFAEILLSHYAATIVSEDTPQSLISILRELGQKLWEVSRSELEENDFRERFLAEIRLLNEESNKEREIRAGAHWNWVAARLAEKATEHHRDLTLQLERLAQRLKTTKLLLEQFQTGWKGSLRNLLDSYWTNRANSPAFAPFLDLQKPGPDIGLFLTALAPAALRTKLASFVTDRMGQLVTGLSALATKVELRQIPLAGINTRWNLDDLGNRIENLLAEKEFFPETGGKRLHIVGKLTGKSQILLDERKGQLARAYRFTSQMIEADFADWCRILMTSIESRVKVEISAALANKSLPNADEIQKRLRSLDRLGKLIRGEDSELPRTPEALASQWLDQLAQIKLNERARETMPA